MATSLKETYVGYVGDLDLYFSWTATKRNSTSSYVTATATLKNDSGKSQGSWLQMHIGSEGEDAGHSTLADGDYKTATAEVVVEHDDGDGRGSFTMWAQASCNNSTPKDFEKKYTIDAWPLKEYTVSFDTNGYLWDSFPPNSSIKYEGQSLSLPQPFKNPTTDSKPFTITGNATYDGGNNVILSASEVTTTTYSFDGWDTSPNGNGIRYYTTYSNDNNVYLSAIQSSTSSTSYSDNKLSLMSDATKNNNTNPHIITFDANGGICNTTTETVSRTAIYGFDGWYSGQYGTGTKYDSNTEFYSDTTIYASFKTISDTSSSINLPIATRQGYSFIGWSTDPYSSATVPNPYTPNSSTILFAVWGAGNSTYKVNHYIQDLDETTYSLPDENVEIKSGTTDSEVTLSSLQINLNGFKYKEGKINGNISATTTISSDGSRVIDLYYTRNSYGVTLNPGSGVYSVGFTGMSQSTTSVTESFKYGNTVQIKAVPDDGYTFEKWSGYTTSDEIKFTFSMPYQNVTFTATAKKITYIVSFDGNGHTSGNTIDITVNDTTGSNLTKNEFIKIGYSFIGWNTEPDGSGTSYSDQELVSGLTNVSNSTVTLYAQWSPNTDTIYTINYYTQDIHSNTYSLYTTTQKVGTSDSTVSINDLHTPINGFIYKEGKVNDILSETTNILPDGSRVIDLFYTRNNYSINITYDEGILNVYGKGTYPFDSEVTITAIIKEGYAWNRWSGDVNSTVNPYTFNMVDHDINIVASTGVSTYTITFNGNGADSGSTADMLLVYGVGMNLNNNGFIKHGYDFIGWNTEPDGTGTSYSDQEFIHNLTSESGTVIILYAIWRSSGLIYLYNSKTSEYDGYQMYIGDNNNTWNLYVPFIGNKDNGWDLY